MVEVRSRLDKGSFPDGSRGSNNVWLHSSLGTLLTQPPSPEMYCLLIINYDNFTNIVDRHQNVILCEYFSTIWVS